MTRRAKVEGQLDPADAEVLIDMLMVDGHLEGRRPGGREWGIFENGPAFVAIGPVPGLLITEMEFRQVPFEEYLFPVVCEAVDKLRVRQVDADWQLEYELSSGTLYAYGAVPESVEAQVIISIVEGKSGPVQRYRVNDRRILTIHPLEDGPRWGGRPDPCRGSFLFESALDLEARILGYFIDEIWLDTVRTLAESGRLLPLVAIGDPSVLNEDGYIVGPLRAGLRRVHSVVVPAPNDRGSVYDAVGDVADNIAVDLDVPGVLLEVGDNILSWHELDDVTRRALLISGYQHWVSCREDLPTFGPGPRYEPDFQVMVRMG